MATRELSSVDVQERADLDRVLDNLSEFSGMSITIDITSDAEALTSAAEYEELAAAAQRHSVNVSISTDDPLRQELALIYGLNVVSTPDAATSILRRRDLQTTVIRRYDTDREPETPEVLTEPVDLQEPDGDRLLAPKGGAVLDPDASYSFVVAPPAKRWPEFSRTADFDVPPRAGRRARTKRKSTGKALNASALVVTGIVVAAAIAVLLVGLLAPSAKIVLVPETRMVSTAVTYGLSADGLALDVALQPTSISDVVAFEATAPATGERQVPAEAARGMIFLTNPFSRTVVLPAGTALQSLDGAQTFLTVEEIDIPAADPFGSATFGTAVVDVQAAEAGPAGNLDSGELAGELESGVLYQNRFPLEGGTLRTETFVTQEDVENLRRQAEQGLAAQVPSALEDKITPGWLMFGGPQTPEPMAATLSAEPGTVAREVSIRAQMRVDGQIYDPAELERLAGEELERRLGAETPEGFSLLLDSIARSAPESVGDGGAVAFVMRGEATIEAYVDPRIEGELANELAGKSEASARAVLDDIQGLAGYQVSYGPEWLPWEPVPQLSNRISVEIDAS